MSKYDNQVYTDNVANNLKISSFEFAHIPLQLSKKEKVDIMVIDDNPKDVELLEELLRVEGDFNFSMQVWHKCSDALDYFSNLNIGYRLPDVIMLDFSMPGMNGMLVLQRLRQIKALDKTPIAIYSSNDNMSLIKDFKNHDATAFFGKPIDVDEFKRFLGM